MSPVVGCLGIESILTANLKLPERDVLINHVIQSLAIYWTKNTDSLYSLPVQENKDSSNLTIPLKLKLVALPDWASDCGVDGSILVPRECMSRETGQISWRQVDWWLAVFLLLEGWHERLWEKTKGVIHSYSFRLRGWDSRAWDHAWVNRIAIFLRRWVERERGSLPKAKITLTHDVDAVSKTMPIRFKQAAFNLFNALRLFSRGEMQEAAISSFKAIRMLFGQGDWNVFEELLKMESDIGLSAVYHFYADDRRKTPKRWLFDPSYDISSDLLKSLLSKLQDAGHEVGLHPAFDSWRDSECIAKQKNILEESTDSIISSCRQHWLRFSWEDTWAAQSKCGIKNDSTLMFNDRPGFRNSSCLSWNPWNPKKSEPHRLRSVNSILMDSHLYDYHSLTDEKRKAEITCWVKECKEAFGECSFLWHPHTLSREYGWRGGLECLLNEISTI